MLVDEEDVTFLKAFRSLVAMATEAREEQKRRVILRHWDDEEWWTVNTEHSSVWNIRNIFKLTTIFHF